MKDRENCILPDRETRRGDWEPEEEFIDRLYGIYRENLVDSPITFMALPVVVRDKETGKFYEAFWHLVTKEDDYSGKRLFDEQRGERVP